MVVSSLGGGAAGAAGSSLEVRDQVDEMARVDLLLQRALAAAPRSSPRTTCSRSVIEVEQRSRGRLLRFQPLVHRPLDFPRRLAEVHQPDHAAAALQRVEAAADGDQRLAVIGPGAALRHGLVDGLEHLARFLEEDREQVRVHPGARVGLRRSRRRFRIERQVARA